MNETQPAKIESHADAEELVRLLESKRRVRRGAKSSAFRIIIYIIICNYTAKHNHINAMTIIVIITTYVAIIAEILRLLLSKFRWGKIANDLYPLLNVKAVGSLIEDVNSPLIKKEAREMLAEILPSLKASDAHLMTERHHKMLNSLLHNETLQIYPASNEFVITVMKAYEQVGGTQDLPTVERLARGEGYGKRNRDVREAAQACLPYLRERAAGQESRQTLLRAASESAADPGTLLRPAQAAGVTAPAELLRPSDSG